MIMCLSSDKKHYVSPETRLYENRIISFVSEFNDKTCEQITHNLLCLDECMASDAPKDIDVILNSGGGSVTAGLGLINTMESLSSKVNIIVTGQAASMGAVFLACATGRRIAQKDSRIMIHQPLGGYSGQASDILIHANEIKRMKALLYKKLTDTTKGKCTIKRMEELCERDNFLTPEMALELGLIDEIR
ncbi:ATP-dependent Clp protease proteolytic subunit [Photobacterium kishitanii]|uniref:ATP-dependent Clp protease proteolytic subunit n=1 Tax=Photobacterium kishitanii TaxID=318456 RepID=A0A2T3KMW1_9GAMM|nr:ATP-dependent Clp protease proteolytic subunit [Photobacterium kishitanii]PSV01136.1 ATP-dependent Clp protease proteolytic subunit [Photobacterium kishitanii]